MATRTDPARGGSGSGSGKIRGAPQSRTQRDRAREAGSSGRAAAGPRAGSPSKAHSRTDRKPQKTRHFPLWAAARPPPARRGSERPVPEESQFTARPNEPPRKPIRPAVRPWRPAKEGHPTKAEKGRPRRSTPAGRSLLRWRVALPRRAIKVGSRQRGALSNPRGRGSTTKSARRAHPRPTPAHWALAGGPPGKVWWVAPPPPPPGRRPRPAKVGREALTLGHGRTSPSDDRERSVGAAGVHRPAPGAPGPPRPDQRPGRVRAVPGPPQVATHRPPTPPGGRHS